MKLTTDKKILIVGLGLLGGSYARALVKKGYYVTAITRSRSSIDYALSENIIVKGASFVDPALVGEADLVVLALYPHVLIDWIRENQHLFKPGTVITDVTGVKGMIVDKIQTMLRTDVEFIAAHPMAGREVYGVQNSSDAIFKGANYVVTPSEKNTEDAIELCRDLGETLGFARVSSLSPKKHDQIIGFVSQLTHCIAMTLMTCQKEENLQDYTGDSFRDLTRIARMNDEMWSELFLLNKDALLHQMTLFEGELNRLRCLLETDDVEGLRDMMRYSTERRALFDKKAN
ncbi:MAG: prephenate dehydrogenase [Clostridia bacterium]|nr:prephenate dehydrogenase [Clostridia bacterium]